MITIDCETLGLVGPMVTLQYAIGNDPVVIHEIFYQPMRCTIDLIRRICDSEVCGFNLTFDWFHVSKIYHCLDWLVRNGANPHQPPTVEQIAAAEKPSSNSSTFCKPKAACDVMLVARQGPYQCVMKRDPAFIRKVPQQAVGPIVEHFKKNHNLGNFVTPKFTVKPTKDDAFSDIVISYHAKGSLKSLAADALGLSTVALGELLEDKPELEFPKEVLYHPAGKQDWLRVAQSHIEFWHSNPQARQYAANDVDYTRRLYQFFGSPTPGDDNSELAIAVACARLKGFALDLHQVAKVHANAQIKQLEPDGSTPIPQYTRDVKKYLDDRLNPLEKMILTESTSKTILEQLSKGSSQGALAAKRVVEARQAHNEQVLCEKFLTAGRLHADINIIGSLSNRMSGAGDLNILGINRRQEIRSCLTLADPGWTLSGGDFDAFEVAIIAAACDDPGLNEVLATGKKIHAIFGTCVFPDLTYDDVIKNKKLYANCKATFLATMYGGTEFTIKRLLDIDDNAAVDTLKRFEALFPRIKGYRDKIVNDFNYMEVDEDGQFIPRKPKNYVESMLGFRRYFDMEYKMADAIHELILRPGDELRSLSKTIRRRDRDQTVLGAALSALYGSLFSISKSIMRAASNHVIQSTGAAITKSLQRKIWDLQPPGIHPIKVMTLSIHDEVLTVSQETSKIANVVSATIDDYKKVVPMLSMDWITHMNSWADKR